MNALTERAEKILLHSTMRRDLDNSLREVVSGVDEGLLKHVLYHLNLDGDSTSKGLSHSKRLRGFLCIAFSDIENKEVYERALRYAAGVELFHSATLAIDDILDNSQYRCGRIALWRKLGIPLAFYISSYLVMLASGLLKNEKLDIYGMNYIGFVKSIISGEYRDINISKPFKFNQEYINMVYRKTGDLIYLSCVLGLIAGRKEVYRIEGYVKLLKELCYRFALHHQILDDIEDGDIECSDELLAFLDQNKGYICNIFTELSRHYPHREGLSLIEDVIIAIISRPIK